MFFEKNTKIVYLKHYEFLLKGGDSYYGFQFANNKQPFYITFSTGESARIELKKYQVLSSQHVLIAGMPRNDEMYTNILNKRNLLDIFNIYNSSIKIVLCMCTFRHGYKRNIDFFRDEFPVPLEEKDLFAIDEMLVDNNQLLIIKTHHAQTTINSIPPNIKNIVFLDNDVMQENGILLHEIYPLVDAMITDYSSAYISFLEFDRPIGFLLADESIYREQRGFIIDDIESIMPGFKMRSLDDLLIFLDNIEIEDNIYSKKRKDIKKMLLGDYGSDNCKSVCDIIMNE